MAASRSLEVAAITQSSHARIAKRLAGAAVQSRTAVREHRNPWGLWMSGHRLRRVAGSLAVAAVLLAAGRASAVCNVIPAATTDFRSGLGSANRPFAGPGDVVEVRVRPAVCDGTSTGFADVDADGSRSDDYVVTVLFTPPNGTPHARVLAESCAGIDLAACTTALGGGSAECVPANGTLQPWLVGRSLSELQFQFPDTDASLDTPTDDRTFAGPAKIVVSRRTAPLSCQLATQRCATLGGNTLSNGVVACIDEFFEPDGTCRRNAAQVQSTFGHFVALPPPNNLERMINAQGITEVRLTTDAAGNVLVPMDYTGVMLRVAGRPMPLLVRAGTGLEAFLGGGQKVAIPGPGFISSYSPEGIGLPPVFTPLSDPSSPTNATLFGSVDAPRGVVRIARQGCVGGTREGRSCTTNVECSGGGTCGGSIFELRDRYASGVGPVLVPASGPYLATRDTPITLESLAQRQASGSFAFVVYESADGVDRNGDGDALDFVLTLRDRATGVLRPIGEGGAVGRAVVQAHEGPFAFPALETSGDLVAFLESEPTQGDQDTNGNGDLFDSVLRIFRLGPTQADEVTSAPLTADAALAFAGRVGAWIGERFFFRTAEAREAGQQTTFGGAGSSQAFCQQALSTDGRFLAFSSAVNNLVPGDTNLSADVFVRDRVMQTTERVSVDSNGNEGNAHSYESTISADGRFVAFVSDATNLVPGDTTGPAGGDPRAGRDVFVRDRLLGTTERVNVDSLENQGNNFADWQSISGDGRFVSFRSPATNLVTGDTNGSDVFVRDRLMGTTERASIAGDGSQANGESWNSCISTDGLSVAFTSYASNLVPGGWIGTQIFVRDRALGTTELASSDSFGNAANDGSVYSSISGDGRFVAFQSSGTNLVAGDTNGALDLFVRDRLAGTTERVSVSSDGVQGDGHSGGRSALSGDGRFVAFDSAATNLVPGDTNGMTDVFVHDRKTGATRRVSIDTLGAQGNSSAAYPSLSLDGRFVAFDSTSAFVPGTNGGVYMRGPAPSSAADRSGDTLLDDTVLREADASGSTATVTDLCPADVAATAGGRVAFLRPETAGPSATAACMQANSDRNGDGDTDDRVVELYEGSTVQSLHCAATQVALSPTRLAALVSEAEEGPSGTDWSGDGDATDRVLALYEPGDPAPSSCAGWSVTTLPGDELELSGDMVALLTSEADLGPAGTDLDGDGDAFDRVLRLVDGATGSLVEIVDADAQPASPQAAEDFVVGANLVAFRTSEAAQSSELPPACSLNGDADCDDDVLQLYVLATGELLNTGQAVVPCPLPECDPRKPYRVGADTVRFLTAESDQAADLNQDGDTSDLLVQVYNLPSREAKVVAEVVAPTPGEPLALGTGSDPLESSVAPAATATTSQVAVARGRCVENRFVACSPTTSACAAGEFCFAEPQATQGFCVRDTGATCQPDLAAGEPSCLAGATCVRDFAVLAISDRDADQLPDPIDNCPEVANPAQDDVDADGVGDACDLQICGNSAQEVEEECDDGNLVDGDGCDSNCRLTACGNGILNAGETCDDGNLLTGDCCSPTCQVEACSNPICGDGILDPGEGCDDGNLLPFDGCTPACVVGESLAVCGNGRLDPGEGCDDGNFVPGDGCSPTCVSLQCANGTDDDGDGLADYPSDPGCTDASDTSEQSSAVACDDGLDNDGDGRIDFRTNTSGDPGCADPSQTFENPQCQNGINDDRQSGIDFDGGASANHGVPLAAADPECVGNPSKNREMVACGLGAEITLALPLLFLRGRRCKARRLLR